MYIEINKKKVFASTGGKPFTKDQPLVLFIHGSGLDHTFWGLHSRFFAFRNYSVLCLDTPGHTNSDGHQSLCVPVYPNKVQSNF